MANGKVTIYCAICGKTLTEEEALKGAFTHRDECRKQWRLLRRGVNKRRRLNEAEWALVQRFRRQERKLARQLNQEPIESIRTAEQVAG